MTEQWFGRTGMMFSWRLLSDGRFFANTGSLGTALSGERYSAMVQAGTPFLIRVNEDGEQEVTEGEDDHLYRRRQLSGEYDHSPVYVSGGAGWPVIIACFTGIHAACHAAA